MHKGNKIMIDAEDEFECETADCCYNHDKMCRYRRVHEQQPYITDEDGCISGVINVFNI